MPRIAGVLETALYVDDLDRSCAFFERVLGLQPMLHVPRMAAYDAGRGSVLLLFLRGASVADMPSASGTIPGHDGAGPMHAAFAIAHADYDAWGERFARYGVATTSEVRWPGGARSRYFADPDGSVLELATPGLWATAP